MHKHDHSTPSHSHEQSTPRSLNTAFAIAVILNLAYSISEAVYALIAQSTSLLADSAHNFGDVIGLILAWMANWLLSFPARKRYSYGFKRITIIAALANACILVGTSAIILYEAIYKIQHLTAMNESLVIIVGLIGILVNGGCSLLFMSNAHHDINIKGAFLHLLADALILVGVVIGAIIIQFTGWLWIDPMLAIIIVALILWGTWSLLRDSVSLILDAIPRYIDHQGVLAYLHQISGVKSIHDLHIWGLSTKEVALTAHLVMPDATLSDEDFKKINETLHEKFHINHATLQVEMGSSDNPCLRSEIC